MLDERRASILQAVIRDFILTGVPVSSERLYKKYRFPVKPATIRNELAFLEEGDFLEQLHTSGGRVPTDKGYQFLVEQILKGGIDQLFGVLAEEFSLLEEEFRDRELKGFIQGFSNEFKVLGAGYVGEDEETQVTYKSGLDDLIRELGLIDSRDLLPIIEDVERLDDRIFELREWVEGTEPRVFIGKSPVTKSNQLSIVAQTFAWDEDSFLLVAIGPKRMNYQQVISCFKKLGVDMKKQSSRKK